MTLEKTKKTTTKIKKSQLQKQKQTQNVIVNLNAPVKKATRKRPIKKPPQLKPVQKTPFQSPIYMPPIASFNPPKQPDNTSILSDLLKIINKPIPKPEPNELEKPKPEEREPAPPPAPTLPTAFGPPDITEQGGFNLANTTRGIREGRGQTRRPQSIFDTPNVFNIPQKPISLVSEIKSDPTMAPTLIHPIRFEAPKEPFKFNTPLPPEPKPPSLVRIINIGQEKKFEPEPKQKWAEVEMGGHFVLPETKATSTLVPTVIEEARPTSEEIDLGIVPQIAQEIVQEDRVETDEPAIKLQPLTMGASATFNKAIIQPSSRAEEEPELQGTGELRGIERLPHISDPETAKDAQYFMDYIKTIGMTAPQPQDSLLTPTREPTLAEKLNMPVAESRYSSPEAPIALAEILVEQAKSKKVNANTDSRLQVADFRNKPELIGAIKQWNKEQPSKQIMTRKADKKGDLTIDELEVEATANGITFAGLKDNTRKKIGGSKI